MFKKEDFKIVYSDKPQDLDKKMEIGNIPPGKHQLEGLKDCLDRPIISYIDDETRELEELEAQIQLLYEKEREEALQKLKPRLTDEFFDTLVLATEVVSWSVDLIEVEDFIRKLCDEKKRPYPNIDPK